MRECSIVSIKNVYMRHIKMYTRMRGIGNKTKHTQQWCIMHTTFWLLTLFLSLSHYVPIFFWLYLLILLFRFCVQLKQIKLLVIFFLALSWEFSSFSFFTKNTSFFSRHSRKNFFFTFPLFFYFSFF